MTQGIYEILQNEKLVENVYKATFKGDTSAITASGQFVNILIEGLYLRRPISIYDYDENTFTIIYKVVGKGTEKLKLANIGDKFDILVGLGNGYNLDNCGDNPLLIGGGVGVPPLYNLAKKLIALGKKVDVILGFNKKEEIFCEKEFKDLGANVSVCTVDGSYGIKGFVVDAIKGDYSYFYTCGPEPMLKAVYNSTKTSGQLSFEERMGCGFGACMGCSCKTLYGNKRICKDGPVLVKEEIIWQK